jgi:hypothetical protein
VAADQLAQLRAAERLDADTACERRPTVIAELERHPGTVALVFEGKEVVFPARAEPAVAAVHAAEGPITAAALPGPLDLEGRVVLLRRLVREGYLQVALA